ncbi:hypothetical protein [Pseudonocardia zijingensis]|uniref:Integral membrane protein n=1 Tax=Pseudonocardia zijingensis TaxID=153376 RepID=A0ABN1P561_9PSEU
MEDAVAWFLMVVGLVVLVVAWWTGIAVYDGSVESASTMIQTRAVLLEDAVPDTSGEAGVRPAVRVDAEWVDPDGVEHTGRIPVRHPAPAGTAVEVWVGPNGDASTTAPGRENAVIAGFVTATGLLLGGGVVLGMAWYGVRFLTAACNARRWGREWERVGPEWSDRLR